MIPALILLIQAVTAVFGYNLDLTIIQDRMLSVVNAVFVLLSVFGIVVDNTTARCLTANGHLHRRNLKKITLKKLNWRAMWQERLARLTLKKRLWKKLARKT